MAPFLILHPQLIDRWVQQREQALALALSESPTETSIGQLSLSLKRARQYFEETWIENAGQAARNETVVSELNDCITWLEASQQSISDWTELTSYLATHASLETQELVNGLLIDLHPSSTMGLEDAMSVDEQMMLVPEMSVDELTSLLETRYAWALYEDYESPQAQHWFWYKSAEKKSRARQTRRRLGIGKELPLAIGPSLKQLHESLGQFAAKNPSATVIEFLLKHPELMATVRRAQTMAETNYGEIRSNLWAESMKPMHLLRAKLSFWVRIVLTRRATSGYGLPSSRDPRLLRIFAKT